MGRIEDKVAVISGGASGLCRATAARFAREGATVVIVDLNAEQGTTVAAEIAAETGRTVEFIKVDVGEESDWIAAYAAVLERHGKVDIVVNGAGIVISTSFPTDTDYADWRKLMRVNVDGVFLGTKHGIAAMQKGGTKAGSIINIASIMGFVAMPDRAAYNASKGAVRLYSKSVALSCAERKLPIRVNSVCPGYTETELLHQAASAFFDTFEEGFSHYSNLQPLGRLATPDDIASGILYLASDKSSFVTGSDLVIDGGFLAR